MSPIELGPPRQDLRVLRGDGIRFQITVTNSQTGAPVDLSSCAIWCTAKRNIADTDAQAVFQVKKTDGSITVSGAGNNIAQVVIPAALTAPLVTSETLFYDVQIKGAAVGDEPQTVVLGMMTVLLDVTRAVS